MKILLHALPIKIGGGVRHLENVLANMHKFPDIKWTVIINDKYTPVVKADNITYLTFSNTFSGGVKRIYFDNVIIKRLINKSNYDLLISFANLGPIKASIPHILFQANARFFCKNIKRYSTLKQKIMFFAQKKLILASCKNAIVVTPSETFKKMLINEGVQKNKIVTLYHAVDQDTLGKNEQTQENDSFVFFYPSHFYNYKGVDILLQAINNLVKEYQVEEKFKVICTFDQNDAPDDFSSVQEYVMENRLEDFIEFQGNCKQDEMAQHYIDADSMVFPSLCESFGFPLIEAKLYHLPSVTADTDINREVSKKGSIYYKSNDPYDMAQKMLMMIKRENIEFQYKDLLSERNWQQYAEEFHKIILNMVNKHES